MTTKTTDNVPDVRSEPDRNLVGLIRQLAEIAESNLPPADMLSLLCTQIGTALFWVEQASSSRSAELRSTVPQKPHYLSVPSFNDAPEVRSDAQARSAP